MDIPEARIEDISWLIRNIGIRNSNHPNFREAHTLVMEEAVARAKGNAFTLDLGAKDEQKASMDM